MVTWKPEIDLTILKSATIKKLEKGHAKQIWNIDEFVDAAPKKSITRINSFVLLLNDPILPQGGIGVDPGLSLGISFIESEDTAHTLSFKIDRSELSSKEILSIIHNVPILIKGISKKTPVIVEGAAYNARYGQALLGAIRGGLILGFVNHDYETVTEVQPLQVRKRVFGSGKVQPKDFWSIDDYRGLNKDAIDAFSMAIAAGI